MAYPPSSYGERPPLQGYRRSFTLPSRQLSVHERAGLDKSDADADTLFSHVNARIIQFAPPTDSIKPQSKETLPDADYPIDAVETLPWRSRTETLLSSGPIKIEKVRGSGHFLKSADQKVVQTIMRNSQCWCVDGETKFVLRIGKLKYYRIELPSETEEEKQKIEEFKTALGKVLRFERTPCPFKRDFHVDLPEDAITPRRKGTWKRRQPLQPTTPNTDPLPLRRTKNSRVWSFQTQNDSSPLQVYNRRGSDFGTTTSRGSSQSRPEGSEFRSSTPSSVLSSEDACERRYEGGSSGENLTSDDAADQQQEQDNLVNHSLTEAADVGSSRDEGDAVTVPGGDHTGTNVDDDTASEVVEHAIVLPRDAPQLDRAPQAEIEDVTTEIVEDTDILKQTEQSLETDFATKSLLVELPRAEPHANTDTAEELAEDSTSLLTNVIDEHLPSEDNTSPNVPPLHAETEETDQTEALLRENNDDALSRVSSVDSFYTTDSIDLDTNDDQVQSIDFERLQSEQEYTPFFLNRHHHHRGLSEMTITASTIASEQSPQKQRPSTSDSAPGLAHSSVSDSSWPEVHTPPTSPIKENLRRRLQAKRSLSPLPPSTTLYSPTNSPANHGSPFTAQFLQKAANVAFVKPIEAVALLVHILARIAGGATLNDLFSGDLFRKPSEREQGVHRRRTSFPDQHALPSDDEEDDFGVPIRGRNKSASPVKSSVKATTSARDTGRQDDQDSIFDLD